MTNKLPEVGKRYQLCVGFNTMEKPEYILCEVKNIFDTSIECYMQHSGITHYYVKDDFLKSWEELPDSQEKPQTTQAKLGDNESIVSEVEKAKKELKDFISKLNATQFKGDYYYRCLEEKAQNLIDALEGGKNQEETKKEEKPKSIWKPVSELPKEIGQVVVKYGNNQRAICFYEYERFNLAMLVTGIDRLGNDIIGTRNIINVYEWCYLSHFINSIEQTKLDHEERLRKLEQKEPTAAQLQRRAILGTD